jgi:hypothetical protein
MSHALIEKTVVQVKVPGLGRKKISRKKNPFANPDNTPKKGQESAFFQWAKENREAVISVLPPAKRAAKQAAAASLKKKMNS